MLDKLKENGFKQGSKPTKDELKARFDKAKKELNGDVEDNIKELELSDRVHQLVLDLGTDDDKERLDIAAKIIENNEEMRKTLYKFQELKISELNLKEKMMYYQMDQLKKVIIYGGIN